MRVEAELAGVPGLLGVVVGSSEVLPSEMEARAKLSVGPFHRPKPNPSHQITDPTQPNLYPGPNPTQRAQPAYNDNQCNYHQNALVLMQTTPLQSHLGRARRSRTVIQ